MGQACGVSDLSVATEEVVIQGPLTSFIEQRRRIILGFFVAIAAGAQFQALSTGPFYRDDAWVALTNRVPLGTAVRMVSTMPGFTMFERFWSGLAPHSTWFSQLPSIAAGLAAIVALYALVKWEGFETWIALSAAFGLAVSSEATTFGTHIKPYSANILITIALIWLAERVRKEQKLTNLVALGAASIAACIFSYTLFIVVVPIFVVINAEAIFLRRAMGATIATDGAVGLALIIEYSMIRHLITPALQQSWTYFYIHLDSLSHAQSSIHRAVGGLFRGITIGYSAHAPWIFGYISEILVALLVLIGLLSAFRQRVLAVSVLGLAVALAMVDRVPIGTDRTDTYLYPFLFLLGASGLAWIARYAKRLPTPALRGLIGVGIFFVATSCFVRVIDAPAYPGGGLQPAIAEVQSAIKAPGAMVLVEGTARWPWAYYMEPTIRLAFGQSFNTGFTPVSSLPYVVISPHTIVEQRFNPGRVVEKLRSAKRVVTINYGDVTGLADPLQTALVRHCWVPMSRHTYDRYIVTQLVRNPFPNCSPL